MESLFIRHYITEMHDKDIVSQEKSGIVNQDSCAEQKITFYYVEPERHLLPVNIRGSDCNSNLIVQSFAWSDGSDAIAFCINHG